MSTLHQWLTNRSCYAMIIFLANITRKYLSRIRKFLLTPIELHEQIKSTILLTSSCNYIYNINFLILLLKKKGRTSQKLELFSQWLFTSLTYLICLVHILDATCHLFDLFGSHPWCQMHCIDKYSQHSSIIWPVWLNGWVFVYELNGCGFESSCNKLA